MHATCPAYLILFDLNTLILFDGLTSFLTMQLPPTSHHLLPLRSKYFPQLPGLKRPQTMFSIWCERPSFIPIQTTAESIVLNNLAQRKVLRCGQIWV